jgi:predicted DNA-binding transcriptional regulator YafY
VTKKLKAAASEDSGKVLDDAEKLISVLGLQMVDHGKHQATIQTVQRALIDRKQLTGRYKSPYDTKPKQLRLTPYRLCLIKQAWYLIAVPSGSSGPHTYRVARFKSLRQVDAPAHIPNDFDLKMYFGNAWTVYRGEPTYDIEIEFTRDASDIVTETTWHATQQVRRNRDGSVRIQFCVDGLEEMVPWVLGWSGSAKIVAPIELRNLVLAQLKAAYARNSAE